MFKEDPVGVFVACLACLGVMVCLCFMFAWALDKEAEQATRSVKIYTN